MVFAANSQNGVDTIHASIEKVLRPARSHATTHDVLVTKLPENAIFFDLRVWIKVTTYWETYYFVHEQISKQFGLDKVAAPIQQYTVNQA